MSYWKVSEVKKTLESYQWGTCLIALAGLTLGVLLDNLLLAIVLSGGSVLLPLAMIYIRSGEYQRSLTASLESGMGIVTNAYIASGDFIQAVGESLHLLPEPLVGWFRTFLTQTQLVDASMDRALDALRRQCKNRSWQDWCGILIQCQADRQLRYALPGIVERLGGIPAGTNGGGHHYPAKLPGLCAYRPHCIEQRPSHGDYDARMV